MAYGQNESSCDPLNDFIMQNPNPMSTSDLEVFLSFVLDKWMKKWMQ